MLYVAIAIIGFFREYLEKYGALSMEALRSHVIDRLNPEKYIVDIFMCQDTMMVIIINNY